MTVTGDDPKKFAAAMVEYSKEKVRSLEYLSESTDGIAISINTCTYAFQFLENMRAVVQCGADVTPWSWFCMQLHITL